MPESPYKHQGLLSSKTPVKEQPFATTPFSQVPLGGRYDKVFYDQNTEEIYARQQSGIDQLANGITKAVGTFATSFVGGTLGLINGAIKWSETGRFADLYDNETNRYFDNINKELENALPNYYTQAEKDAEWYSPTNIFSTNFLGDKVLKNLGYSFGALAGGFGWGSVLKGIGLTAKLARAGKALQAIEVAEAAMANSPKLGQLGAINKGLTSLWNSTKGAVGTGLLQADRATISLMGTFGEASIEAMNNANVFRNKLIEDYKSLYGTVPTGEALEEINSYADNVGNTTFGANVALLTFTNYVQLPKILGSSKTLERKAAINSIEKEGMTVAGKKGTSILDEVESKFVAGTPTTGNILSPVISKLGKPGRFLDKYILGPGRLTFSAGEAFEEGAQYSIETGVTSYFDRAYENKEDMDGFFDGLSKIFNSVVTDGVKETLTSKEGLESILIGGVSGGLQKIRGNIKERGFFGTTGEIGTNTQLAIDALNKTNTKQVLQDVAKYAAIGSGSQQLRQAAIANNDTLNEKNYEADYALSYILPRVKYGKEESIYAELDLYREQVMTDGGFEQLQAEQIALPGETKEKFIQRLDNIKRTTEQVKEVYSQVNDKYSTITDIDGKLLYTPDVIDKMVYSISKVSNFDKRLLELETKLIGSGVTEGLESVKSVIRENESFKSGDLKKAIEESKLSEPFLKTINDIGKGEGLDNDEVVKDFVDFTELLIHRQKFINDYNELKNFPEKFKEAPIEAVRETPTAKVPGIKVTTEEGDFEISTGEEYYAAKRIGVKETDGKVVDITRFKILEETPEGNIKIQTPDGKIHTVSKKAFEKVTLGKVSDVTTDNGKFFVETHDHIFTYNRGGGKKIEGRLYYDKTNDTLTFKSLDGKFVKKVTRDQFSPKEGFNVAQIYSNKKFTPIAEEAAKKPVSLEEKLAVRNQIIADLHDSSKKRLDEINQKLESNKKKLSETVEALDNLSKTKEGLPRKKFTKAIRKTIDTLSKIKNDVEQEIAQLEIEREDLQLMLPYFEDLAQNVQELPEKGGDLLNELKDQVNSLEEMIDNTNEAIKSGKSLIKSVESALDNALSLMNDFVRRLKEENPNVPLSIEELQARLEKYQGEEGAKQFIAEKLGFTELVIELQDQIDSFGEELKIPDLTKKIERLTDQIKELESGLDGFIAEQMAKQKVLSTLEEYAERIKKQKEEEAKLKKNEELRKQLLGTNSNDTANDVDQSKSYQQESKKDDLEVVGSTIAASYEDAKKPFNQRANRFGFRFNSLENREDIKGMIVTAKTEDGILPGLTAKLVEGTNIPTDGIIALVMVQDNGDGTFTLVDEFGAPIPEGANALDLAIFQVFPESKLTATYNGEKQTMFRETTPDYVEKALREQYTKWREDRLKETELGEPKNVSASFGIPKFVKYITPGGKEETDHNARTSAQDAGLIDENSLVESPLITVATNNDAVSNGTVTFKTPLGRVFLKVPGGLAKLFNTKFSRKKATLIYDVINQLAKNTLEDGSAKTERSQNLISWLKSVVYWGIPKNLQTGERKESKFNSVFFEDVPTEDGTTETRLFISGRGASFEFSPSALEQNKEAIIALLEGMYHNANATSLNAEGKYKQPYLEIVGLNTDGTPIYKEWKNYQSYLLSNKDADGKKRSGEDTPLTTKFRPLKDKDDTNREGIYFTLDETIDDYVIPQRPIVKSAPAPQAPQAPKPAAPTNTYKLDGTMETMTLGTFGDVQFSIDGKVLAEVMQKQMEETNAPFKVTVEVQQELIKRNALNFDIPETVVNAVATGKNIDVASAQTIIVTSIVNKAASSVKIDVPSTGISTEQTQETPAATATEAKPAEQKPGGAFANRKKGNNLDNEAYRLKLAEEANKFEGENWNKLEQWLKKNFPNVPIYRVKNILKATNGRQAWGKLRDGAIYVYQNAEVGTAYHEVFEAVWKMFTDGNERLAVLKEFRGRKGEFIDRETGKKVEFSKATDQEIKEQLAEEFRDYVMSGKIPAKPTVGKPFILKLFADLVSFIKEFFTGAKAQTNTANLFAKIGNGYYKDYIPFETNLSYAKAGVIDIEDAPPTAEDEYRLINVPAVQRGEIMQHMTYTLLSSLSRTNQSLFQISEQRLPEKEIYESLKQDLLNVLGNKADLYDEALLNKQITKEAHAFKVEPIEKLYNEIDANWEEFIEEHKEFLKPYGIEFDENDSLQLTDENKTKESDFVDARKVDGYRKANAAIKMLFATVPVTTVVDGKPELVRNTIGAVSLLPADKVFITLKNELYDAVNLDDMLEKFRKFALGNPNYWSLYRRLTKNLPTETDKYGKLTAKHDWQLMSGFWKVMKGQNPDVKTVFVLPTGDVVVGDSSLSSAAAQAKYDFMNDIIGTIRDGKNPYVSYNTTEKTFNATTNINKVNLDPSKLETYVQFLDKIGIPFDIKKVKRLKDSQKSLFIDAVNGIKKSMSAYEGIKSLTKKTLDVDKRLMQLGTVQAVIENPEFESTYFNLNGERVQTYLNPNALSNLHDVISKAKNFSELAGTAYNYLLTDVFVSTVKNGNPIAGGGSLVLRKIFNIDGGTGKRFSNTEDILQTAYVDGTVNEEKNKNKESSKLNYKERFVQEINLNVNGYYLNLVPGDASIEHAVKLHNSDDPFVGEEMIRATGYKKVFELFKDYFISEVELSRDGRKIVNIAGRDSKDLRFFKSILGEKLHNKIILSKKSAEEIYKNNEKEINAAIENFINEDVKDVENTLRQYEIVYNSEEGMVVEGLEFAEKEGFTEEDLTRNLKMLSVNYMIANIELHKLLYSDPYQYKDELKRVKSFSSPRQALMDSDDANVSIEKVYNEGYKPGDFGYTEMSRNYLNSTAVDDVMSSNDLYPDETFEETDGGGFVSMKANRWIRIKAGNWNDREEDQYRYDVAYYKMVRKPETLTKAEKEKYGIKDAKQDFPKFLKLNPGVRSAYTTIKPIVSGNKEDGKDYNDIVLDKFALTPVSFRIAHQLNPESNAVKFAEKMDEQNLDYAVYNTGRKVGSTVSTPLYKEDGTFNDAPFNEINKIPFSIMGIQTEVPSKEDERVTQGSQVTKLVTMDMLEAGVPIDFEPGGDIDTRFAKWISLSEKEKEKSEIYRLVKNNQKILEEKIQNGYENLLDKLGITETKEGFKLTNPKKLIESLESEILKRDVNANIFAAFKGYAKGQVVLEATPAYQQIRYVLFSIADKNVISQKISGGQKVQIPSTLFEGTPREAKVIVNKEGKSTNTYQSDFLKFYENKDGERVCEVMVGRWFDSPMSDEELLKYLNETPEGQKILKGVAFRIPTQKQNSIDVFRIKQFLPKEFGDNVVIPSALVKKVGSDFDIDKLSMYLKNTFSGIGGKLEVVPFYGFGEQAKEKFKDLFYNILQSKIDRKEAKKISTTNLQTLFGELSLGKSTDKTRAKWVPIFKEMFADELVDDQIPVRVVEQFFIDKMEKLGKDIDKLTDFDIQEVLADEFKNKKYSQSLENAYIESMEELVSHPLNFDNLVKANSADQMKQITKDILDETKEAQFDYTSVGNMLKRNFMSQLRHAFVTGKYAIGIAAIAQTNHAQSQRGLFFVNDDLLESDRISLTDKKYLGDAQVKFREYNSVVVNGKKRPTLSMSRDANEEKKERNFISDVIGQFIDGYVDISKGPWIMQLRATPNVASTWLFLVKLGVPIRSVGYFMNQPIVRDLLRNIESSGYTWLFNDRIISDVLDAYSPQSEDIAEPTEIPSEDALFKMLKYNQIGKKAELTDLQKVQQQFILKEFLKYAKMAEHLLHVTQGSNFDTATINDPFIIFKKKMQLQKGRQTILSSLDENNNIIPAVDGLLQKSFVGKLKDAIFNVRDAFATFLISDRPSEDPTTVSTREVLEAVLLPYVTENDRDFVKIARKAVSDLFDWATQTNTQVNTQVETILLGKDGKASAAKEIMEFVKKVKEDKEHPLFNNILINSFKLRPGFKEGVPDNLEIVGKGNKTYDQNQIIFSFNELINNLKETNPQLRSKFLRLAVLQSGLSTSPVSFTTLLPYEDFLTIYNETLSAIDKMPNLADYYTTSVFQRANAKNDDVVPFVKAKLRQSKKNEKRWYNPAEWFVSDSLKKAMKKGQIPDVFVFSLMSREGASDFITYSWENRLTKAQRALARRKGSRDHINTVLLKKVYKADGTPLIQSVEYQGVIRENFVFKAINAWGDSIRGKELYGKLNPADTTSTISRASVLDNGFKKITEVEDGVIEQILEGSAPTAIAPTQPSTSVEKIQPEGKPEIDITNENNCG